MFLFDYFLFCDGGPWGPGIEGRLTRERDSEAKTMKTDEKSSEIMKNYDSRGT